MTTMRSDGAPDGVWVGVRVGGSVSVGSAVAVAVRSVGSAVEVAVAAKVWSAVAVRRRDDRAGDGDRRGRRRLDDDRAGDRRRRLDRGPCRRRGRYRGTAVDRHRYRSEQLFDRHLPVAVAIESRARVGGQATERDVHPAHQLVDGHLDVPVAVAGTARGRRRGGAGNGPKYERGQENHATADAGQIRHQRVNLEEICDTRPRACIKTRETHK